jgi:hypothetical protein
MKADEIAHGHKKSTRESVPTQPIVKTHSTPVLVEKKSHKLSHKKPVSHSARSISDIESDRLKTHRPDVWHKIQNWD